MEGDWTADGPYYRVQLGGGDELSVLVGDDEPMGWDSPCDFTLQRATGTRWRGTAATLEQLRNILDRWRASGEGLGGEYIAFPHLLIVRTATVSSIRAAIEDLLDQDTIGNVLEPVIEPDSD